MIKKILLFLILFSPILTHAFDVSGHYQAMFDSYRKNNIDNKIEFLSGKTYPEITKAICNNVDYHFDNVIISIIWHESRFNSKAKSKIYAWGNYYDWGLMQVSCYFWAIDKNRIFEPNYNIKLGYTIYTHFWNLSNQNLLYSLKLYNGSINYAKQVFSICEKLSIQFKDSLC